MLLKAQRRFASIGLADDNVQVRALGQLIDYLAESRQPTILVRNPG